MFAANVLAGQTALVTGGGTGLGLAIARALGKLGARVVIASRKREHLDPGANAIRGDGTAVLPVQVDIREPEQVDAMVAQAIDAFGHIDILVNNAGVTHAAGFLDLAEEDFDRVLRINLKSMFLCSQAVARATSSTCSRQVTWGCRR